MPFGMGWLVDVRDLIMKNPLWMFLIFLCIVKYRLTIERKLKGPEAENYEEQYNNYSYDDDDDFDDEFYDEIYDEKPKWYKKLFRKMKRKMKRMI